MFDYFSGLSQICFSSIASLKKRGTHFCHIPFQGRTFNWTLSINTPDVPTSKRKHSCHSHSWILFKNFLSERSFGKYRISAGYFFPQCLISNCKDNPISDNLGCKDNLNLPIIQIFPYLYFFIGIPPSFFAISGGL